MNCQQAKPLIAPYADGELEAAAILEMEQHLHSCAGCGIALRNLQSLKKSLKQDALYFAAPEELRRRIKSGSPSPAIEVPPWRAWNWNWLSTVITGAAAACLALLLTVAVARHSSEQPLAQEIVSSHVRSLMANHMLDVVSTDQHTVKPWFNGKLDFSPPVKNLAEHDFPLIGGRLDYIGGHSAAALIYQRHKHFINLFIWPAKANDSKPVSSAPLRGYNTIHWSEAGMMYWAASDLNEKELTEFALDFVSGKTGNP